MSPFVEPRGRPIGNTFIEEDVECENTEENVECQNTEEDVQCEHTRATPMDSQACKRRHSFNHRAHCHSRVEVDLAAFHRLARALPPKEKVFASVERRPCSIEKALKIADSLPAPTCQAMEPLELPSAALRQASDCMNPMVAATVPFCSPAAQASDCMSHPILSTNGPFCSPPAQVIFMGSPVHSPTAFSPMGAGGFCPSIPGAAPPPMMWVPESASAAQWPETPLSTSGRVPSKRVQCLPLTSLIPPPSPTASTDTSVAGDYRSEGSDSVRFSSEGAISLDAAAVARDAPGASAEVPHRRSRRAARRAAAAAAAAAAPPKAAAPPAASAASSPTGSAAAGSPAGSTGRPQPREDLVRELLKTGASALERAAALAKELHGSGGSSPTESPTEKRRR